MKIEVGDTKVQRKKIVAWPKHIHFDECNNDDEDTLPWSPPSSPRNDIIASTVPWIDVVSRNNAEIVNSVEEISLFGSESEQEESLEITKVQFKTAYVAIQKLKLPGLRFSVKTSKKKRRRKVKQPKTRWVINPDSKDEDWTPSPARRLPARIKLVKRRPVSDEADDELWEENNFSNRLPRPQRRKGQSLFLGKKLETKEERRMQKWKGTDEQHQSELMKFYKDLQETKEKTKREEEKMLKAKSAKNGVSVISIHGSEEELGKDLRDEIMSEGRGSEASLRPSLRPPVSGDRRGLQSRWILARLNSDESKSDKIDSKKEDSNIPKQVSLMEGRRDVSTLEVETPVEDSLETEAKERSEEKDKNRNNTSWENKV